MLVSFGNFSYFYNMPLGLMLFYIAFLGFTFLFAINNKWKVIGFCCTMIHIVFTIVAVLGGCDLSSASILLIVDILLLVILIKRGLR